MSLISKITDTHQTFSSLEKPEKKNLLMIGGTLFLLFFSYPFLRTTTTSLLLTHHGVKASPHAWIYSVICLSFVVGSLNFFQKKMRAQVLYFSSVLFTCCFFLLFFALFKTSSNIWAYMLYVLKEVYIVILVHSVLGHLNASINEEKAKVIYGPLGAIGSIGGILGAFSIGHFVKNSGEEVFFLVGVFTIFLTSFVFWQTTNQHVHLGEAKERSPLKSIQGIKSFVFFVSLIVLLSQFVINIGNYQFNVFLNGAFTDSVGKTEYLGKVYGFINTFSLAMQLVVLPLLLKFCAPMVTHVAIPVVYGISFFIGISLGGGLMPMAITFIVFKGLDYSLFGAAKELLYYALTDIQKYGAKYVADMITYRFSKGLISLILIKIPDSLINALLGVSIVAWLLCLFPLFNSYKNLHGHTCLEENL